MTKFDHRSIERKWQGVWESTKAFRAEIDRNRPKYYILDMFPYPSGAGLHVGHVVGYTATDVVARYKRAKGFSVLHPMGWDSFGLPAEQYAIRTGTHPSITTKTNIDTYRRQLKALGFSYDWDREIATSDATYYKWTQWIFTLLYEQGLAYEAELLVNYCPALGTVLSNEEVDSGKSKEGGHPIVRKSLKQWVLKITAYADRLLEDLEELDWPEGLKRLQRNWIGKSEGALIRFGEEIEVFTTRPDTLHGVTYIVIAPEHPMAVRSQLPAVQAYCKQTASKSDLERTELNKEKTGAQTEFTVPHPVTGEALPVWVADYVLGHYGTGAVMAVPSIDERDRDFALVHHLPVKETLLDPGAVDWLVAHGRGEPRVSYKLRDWLFSRQRYWGEPFPILHFADGTKRVLGIDELPLCPPQVESYKPTEQGLSPLAGVRSWVELVDPVTGKKAYRETNTMPQWAGSCWYYLRFVDPINTQAAWGKEAEKYWMPVDLYVGGVEHAVLHLLYSRFWHKVLFDLKLVSTKEPFQALRNQGMIGAPSYKRSNGTYVTPEEAKKSGETFSVQIEKMSKSKLNGVTPDEMIEEFGADALRIYELFLGPLEKEKVWDTEQIQGTSRFLDRFWDLADKVVEEDEASLKLAHRLLHGTSKDIDELQFNTAIAKMMTFLNNVPEKIDRRAYLIAIQCLAPFAPHIAEELWQRFGGQGLVSLAPFPAVNPAFLVDQTATYVVQVNGKLRGRFDLPKGKSQEEILALAYKNPNIAKHLTQGVQKVIFVPDKLLNFVVQEV